MHLPSNFDFCLWLFQVNQERMLMEYNLSRAGGQALQMEKCMIQQNHSKELELNALRGEIASLKKVPDMIMPSNPWSTLSLYTVTVKITFQKIIIM